MLHGRRGFPVPPPQAQAAVRIPEQMHTSCMRQVQGHGGVCMGGITHAAMPWPPWCTDVLF